MMLLCEVFIRCILKGLVISSNVMVEGEHEIEVEL